MHNVGLTYSTYAMLGLCSAVHPERDNILLYRAPTAFNNSAVPTWDKCTYHLQQKWAVPGTAHSIRKATTATHMHGTTGLMSTSHRDPHCAISGTSLLATIDSTALEIQLQSATPFLNNWHTEATARSTTNQPKGWEERSLSCIHPQHTYSQQGDTAFILPRTQQVPAGLQSPGHGDLLWRL